MLKLLSGLPGNYNKLLLKKLLSNCIRDSEKYRSLKEDADFQGIHIDKAFPSGLLKISYKYKGDLIKQDEKDMCLLRVKPGPAP